MIYFFSFVRSSEYNLLYHFIQYYLSLGIEPDNMFLILHKVDDTKFNKSCRLLERNNISYQVVYQYSSDIKKTHVNLFLYKIPLNSWLIYPDLDEFFEYDGKISDYITTLEKKEYNCVRGIFNNRIANNNELKMVELDENIFKQFPHIYIDIDNKLTGNIKYDQHKIILLKKFDEKLEYISSHNVNLMTIQYPEFLRIHHFKFTYYTISNIIYKKRIYAQTTKAIIYKNQLKMFIKKNDKFFLKL